MSSVYRPPQARARGAGTLLASQPWADVTDGISGEYSTGYPVGASKKPARIQNKGKGKAARPSGRNASAYVEKDCPPAANGGNEDEREGGGGNGDAAKASGADASMSAASLRRERRQRAAAKAASTQPKAEAASGNSRARRGPPTRHPRKGAGKGSPLDAVASVNALKASLESGGDERAAALKAICRTVLQLSLDAEGCRVVQTAFEMADPATAEDLVAGLHGHVCEAVVSPHGNYVIQRLIEVMPTVQAAFVTLELGGKGAAFARHRYGCRILCRLLEHSAHESHTMAIIDEVVAEAVALSRHAFGHHVIQSIFEHSTPGQIQQIVAAIRTDLPKNSQNRNSTYVIEKALTYCSYEDRMALVDDLLEEQQFEALAPHQFGYHIIRALSKLPGDGIADRTMALLKEKTPLLQSTKFGAKLLQEVGLLTAQHDPGKNGVDT